MSSVSMFSKCPQCGAMIVKDTACPTCHHSENGPPTEQQTNLIEEFARRQHTHTQNYTIYMVLMFALGIVGLLCAWCWYMAIFRGSVLAFVGIVIFTAAGGGIGYVLKISKTLLPTEFTCPACNIRLDEMPLNGDHCPGCSVKLR